MFSYCFTSLSLCFPIYLSYSIFVGFYHTLFSLSLSVLILHTAVLAPIDCAAEFICTTPVMIEWEKLKKKIKKEKTKPQINKNKMKNKYETSKLTVANCVCVEYTGWENQIANHLDVSAGKLHTKSRRVFILCAIVYLWISAVETHNQYWNYQHKWTFFFHGAKSHIYIV